MKGRDLQKDTKSQPFMVKELRIHLRLSDAAALNYARQREQYHKLTTVRQQNRIILSARAE